MTIDAPGVPGTSTEPPESDETTVLPSSDDARGEVRDSAAVTGHRLDEWGGGERTLSGLLRVHPLMTFFCWLADRQFPESHRPDTRVARLRERDPRFYWFCVVVDTVLASLAAFGLLAVAAYAAVKTIVL